jgi:hypothetical protein
MLELSPKLVESTTTDSTKLSAEDRGLLKSKKFRDEHPGYAAAASKKWRDKRISEGTLPKYTYSPEKLADNARKHRHGISRDEFLAKLAAQDYKCPVCSKPLAETSPGDSGAYSAHVDHCHITGKLRDLLCRKCNLGLGQFLDNPELLIKAAEYLRKWGA